MRNEIANSMQKSMGYIKRYESTLLGVFKASRLIACEGDVSEVAKHLDMSCGIDYVVVSIDGSLTRGIGCRVQEDKYPVKYRTFTIRNKRDSGSKTEFEKRKNAIKSGGLYPFYTAHIYVDEKHDRIDRMAIAKTEDIIWYCETQNPPKNHTGESQIGQAEFYTVGWDDFRRAGKQIIIYPDDYENKQVSGDAHD